MPRPKNNRETEGIRRMIHQHLQRRVAVGTPVSAGVHLDEDALSAFIEGRLSEQESAPVVQHLVACGFCRRITAQLVRLAHEIGPSETVATEPAPEEPGRIRSLLDRLSSRVFPQAEGDSVFAYHAPAEDFKRKAETPTNAPVEKSEDEKEGGEKPDDEKADDTPRQ